MSTVSVIVTNDNQTQFVMQAVESVLAQTFGDIEIIIVDCGGTDDTPEALEACQDRITYVRRPSRGLLAARAAGLQASAGTHLLFMRADDLLPPGKVELQIKRLEERPELGLAYWGGQVKIREATQIIREVTPTQPDAEVAMEFLLSGCPLIRRDCVERAGLLEAHLSPDSDWNPWRQLSLAGYEVDPQEQLILCREHLTIFLRRLHRGDVSAAQRHMTEAVRLSPWILENPAVFIESVIDYVKNPNVHDAVAFAQAVLENLPDCARDLERFRGRTLAELSISRAFESYRMGDASLVMRRVIAGLRNDWSHLRNKGVVSIFCRSFLNHSRKTAFAGRGNKERDVWRSMVERIQEVLGLPVDSIEPTVGGTDRVTYVVRSGGCPYILRVGKEQSEITAHRSDMLALRQAVSVVEQIRGVGVPVPSILAYDFPTPDTTDPAWVLEEWVPGHFFIPQNMVWRDALSVVAQLGEGLRRLHSIETKGFGPISSERLDAAHETFDQWLDRNILDERRMPATLPSEALSLVDTAGQFLRGSYSGSPRLCHGDLGYYNLLVSRGRLSAIIDWNPVYGWDPAFDVAVFHFWSDDEPVLTTLLQAYAPDRPRMFRRRVMAAVICYAGSLMATACKPTIDKQAVDRLCLRWLTDNRIASSFSPTG
jgi:glycosyltransferase involved in cell wall biosynthesis/aminoglycoside phosphotransferase (APT) family kinase protein